MNGLEETLLPMILASKFSELGLSDDLQKDDAMTNVLSQCTDMINNVLGNLLSKTGEAIKVASNVLTELKDKQGPTPVPQQEETPPAGVPAPQETPSSPVPDAGMTPPPEMNVPPAPDIGMQPPMPDAGVPPQPNPDMTQFSPDMIGAVQPRF